MINKLQDNKLGALTSNKVTPTKVNEIIGVLNHSYTQIGKLIGADMNSTADQLIKLSGGTKFIVTDIIITNASTSLTTAGGVNFFNQPSQGGTVVAYGNTTGLGTNSPLVVLTTRDKAISLIRVAQDTVPTGDGFYGFLTNPVIDNNLYFSLYVAQGTPATADIYVFGYTLK